jgi:hypothetical protein
MTLVARLARINKRDVPRKGSKAPVVVRSGINNFVMRYKINLEDSLYDHVAGAADVLAHEHVEDVRRHVGVCMREGKQARE